MPIPDWLYENYNIQPEEKRWVDGKECFKSGEYVYFTISIDNNEVIHMEQAVVAYYLAEDYYVHMAVPIQNHQGEWFTPFQDAMYMVIQGKLTTREFDISDGKLLAEFHQIGNAYQYEPKAISSYGQWKELWIAKVNSMEEKLAQEARISPSAYNQLVMDVLPYIIGISENAIQYIRESEQEQRYYEVDQGTVAFRRYANQLIQPIMWPMELVYDHPARDISEFIRQQLLANVPPANITRFLNDYQAIRSLSVFSWRLVYARLLFPIHLFDFLERNLIEANSSAEQFKQLLQLQSEYEQKLGDFYNSVDIDCELLQIPVLHWL
ncbi:MULTISPECIES: protein kinase family protein [Virgibacillus]|uniref:Spore coat protein YutH n=2 Tax=Virgibacillus TaxID=84406 RepID=A0A024QAA2_9BACI|nr:MULTISPECIES: hypothetical protein [Virgibacillus]EQB37294.1 hypothetical protein M948_01795 [Virgibacillus sp. CM-4]GGJ62555.1 spore coat protein YutH [Virgibacillus kapii]CDQ39207.1 spore coat protein YutH [Virgibacillus massiliensis]